MCLAVSDYYFGSKLYVNMILLGVAVQSGTLPVSPAALEWAIRLSVSKDDRQVEPERVSTGPGSHRASGERPWLPR